MDGITPDIVARLDLAAAMQQACVPNDLLPSREEDRVGGELGKRYAEHLRKQLEEGRYEPDPASFVPVPKPGFTSRPAALLTLTDRVLYEALVSLLRPRLAKVLLDPEVVLWPRETYVEKRWAEFEGAPLTVSTAYVVQADVAGFYETISHDQLEDDLVQLTGERQVAKAISAFLSRVMNSPRGLPQGLLPSDTLATTYLQPLDAALLRQGFHHWRHGDDIRVAADTIPDARESIALIEHELRNRGLLVSGSKCAIITRENYEASLLASDAALSAARESLLAARIEEVASDDEELISAMEKAQLDEDVSWALFYHMSISIDEVIDMLREHLQPTDIEVAQEVFLETVRHGPGSQDPLPKEQFHAQITRSLLRLAAARSPVGLRKAAWLTETFPEKTGLVCTYLQAMMRSHSLQAVRQAEKVLLSAAFTTAWQQAWLLRVLGLGSERIAPATVERLEAIANDEAAHWLARVEAMKVLARLNRLDRDTVLRSWRLAPRPYRSDLLEATAFLRDSEEWARRFLKGTQLDPVEKVVVSHLTSQART